MARIGLLVNLANRVKRIGSYTEIYLLQHRFVWVCYDYQINGGIIRFRKEYGITSIQKDMTVVLSAGIITITCMWWTGDIVINKIGMKKSMIILDAYWDLFRKLDFNNLYWLVIENYNS